MKALLPLLLLATLALTGCQNQAMNVAGSRESAEEWVKTTLPDGYRLVKFSSATLDTDEDGYVTADILVTRGDGWYELIQLDTPTRGTLSLQKGGAAKLKMIPYNNRFRGAAGSAEAGGSAEAMAPAEPQPQSAP
jgi:hypothetical protein